MIVCKDLNDLLLHDVGIIILLSNEKIEFLALK